MMWYEMPGITGYRINHRGELMSLKGPEPLIMKTWFADGAQRVMLRQNGSYINYKVHDLLELAGVHKPDETPAKVHHESARGTCDNGHPYSPDNIYWRKGNNGKRYRKCRRCQLDANKRWRAKTSG